MCASLEDGGSACTAQPVQPVNDDALAAAVSEAIIGAAAQEVTELVIIIEPVRIARATPLRIATGCVGIASWALHALYTGATRRLHCASDDRTAAHAAAALLAAVPDDLRAWGVRKRALSTCICKHVCACVKRELALTALLLTRAPKAAAAWAHRAWVLRRTQWARELLHGELCIARDAASRAQANYYAGVHRAKLLPLLQSDTLDAELVAGRKWLQTHPTDPSGWWYHGALLRALGGAHVEEHSFVADMMPRYGHRCAALRLHAAWWRERRAGAQAVPRPGDARARVRDALDDAGSTSCGEVAE